METSPFARSNGYLDTWTTAAVENRRATPVKPTSATHCSSLTCSTYIVLLHRANAAKPNSKTICEISKFYMTTPRLADGHITSPVVVCKIRTYHLCCITLPWLFVVCHTPHTDLYTRLPYIAFELNSWVPIQSGGVLGKRVTAIPPRLDHG